MKQKYKSHQQDMFHLVERWEQSGMSLRAFSKSEVISYEKLRYWKRKFNGSNINTRQKLSATPKDIPDFISVEVPNNVADFSGLQLTFPNQVKVTCPSDIGLDTLKSLIKLF